MRHAICRWEQVPFQIRRERIQVLDQSRVGRRFEEVAAFDGVRMIENAGNIKDVASFRYSQLFVEGLPLLDFLKHLPGRLWRAKAIFAGLERRVWVKHSKKQKRPARSDDALPLQ